MKTLFTASLVLALALVPFSPAAEAVYGEQDGPAIQIAILLDTSSSMDGLIDQARGRIWNIVNSLEGASRDGESPRIEVALYEYGNTRISGGDGSARLVVPLTEDMDRVAESLFTLKTQGGNEYCGLAIRSAEDELRWSEEAEDYRAIFIIGNEPFNQGPVDFRESCRKVAEREITVNTIFCGPHKMGIDQGWKEGADLGGGYYAHIDHTMKLPNVKTPLDGNIADLAEELNRTYIPYGEEGAEAWKRQNTIDERSRELAPDSFMQRQVSKAQGRGSTASWDLLEAVEAGVVSLDGLRPEDLPEELRGKTPEEMQAYLDDRFFERERLQHEMMKLIEEREEYLSGESAPAQAGPTLDTRMVDILKKQVTERGFELE